MMYKTERFTNEWLKVEQLPFPCEIHVNKFQNNLPDRKGTFRVFLNSTEPQPVCQPIEDVIKHKNDFDLILTKTPKILEQCENSRLFLFGDCSVYPITAEKKELSVSFLCTSNRGYLPGYEQRHELWSRQNEIKLTKKFWSSRWRPVDTTRLLPEYAVHGREKIHLFNSMFSICPENFSEPNYFTEKIMDCFWTKTVPLYWGCSNIDKYFDSKGIIWYNSIDELIDICNNLTEEKYHSMNNAIEYNWKIALHYCLNRIHSRVIKDILSFRGESYVS